MIRLFGRVEPTYGDSVSVTNDIAAINQDEQANKATTLRTVKTGQSSTADLELANRVRNLFFRARQHRRPLVRQWMKNYQLLRNRTWVAGRADWAPAPEVPEIYPVIASMVGWMTDQRPTMEAVPAMPPHSSAYEYFSGLAWDMQTVMDSVWHNHKFESEVEKMLWDGYLYGNGFLKSTWDDSLDGGLGNVSMRRIDPFTFYPDPQATSEFDSNYFIEARTMSLQEVDRRFPGSASALMDSGWEENVDVAPSRVDPSPRPPMANPGAISPATAPRYGLPGQSRLDANSSTYEDYGVTVFECWMREHTLDDSSPDDPEVFDEWRVVVVVGNHVLLNERAVDIWSHPRHPYSRYVPQDTGEFWGFSLVEMLAPSQLAINRLLAAIQLNIELVGNPILKEGSRSGIARTKITNRPGQRLTVNESSSGVDWLQPPQLQPSMLPMVQFYISEMERVSGLSAITRGGTPTGRNSQGVLDSIQESSFVRVRMALRNLEYTLREQGNLQASLISEFYDTPRMVAHVGASGERTSLSLKGRHFYVPSDGEHSSLPLKFDILINAGSSLSTSATARRQDAATLFAMGALDAQAVLEAYNWPNRVDIVKRIQAQQAAGMQQVPGARQRAGRQS